MKRWLLALFGLAFGIRLAFGLLVAPDLPTASDVDAYREMAANLAAGDGLSRQVPVERGSAETELRPTAKHPPVHPVVLAVADRVGIGSMGAQRAMLAVVGAVGVVAGAWGVAGLTDRRVGLVAGLIAAVHPLRFQLPGMLVSEAVYLAILGGLVVAVAFAVERRSLPSMAVLGGVAGLAALTRSEAILVVAFVAVPVAVVFGWRRLGARAVLVTAASAAVVVAPWVVRNVVVMDTPQISLNGGVTLAGSNCEETYAGERMGGFSLNCAVASAMTLYANPSPTDAEKDRAGRDLAISFARSRRGDLPEVVVARVGRSLGVSHRADALDFDVAEGRSRPWQRIGIGLRLILLPVAVAGAVVAYRRRVVAALMVSCGLVAVAIITSALVYGSTRMGLTLEPGETLLASFALVAVADRIRPNRVNDSDGGAADAAGSLTARQPAPST